MSSTFILNKMRTISNKRPEKAAATKYKAYNHDLKRVELSLIIS